MSIGCIRISNAGVVNVADTEKQEVVPLTTIMKHECVSLLKPQSQLAQLHDDDEDVFATSLINRYAAIPI